MKINKKLLVQLQNRLKVGNKRGVHLNAIPGRSRSKFDISRLNSISKGMADDFVHGLLRDSEFSFPITVRSLQKTPTTSQQDRLKGIQSSFQNLTNDSESTELEQGINSFGFGFPLVIRRDQADKSLTVAPLIIWSLRIRRLATQDTWEIARDSDDPVYVNEVLLNHLRSDSDVFMGDLAESIMNRGSVSKKELVEVCSKVMEAVAGGTPHNFKKTMRKTIEQVKTVGTLERYDKKIHKRSRDVIIQPSGILSSAFEVQKQSIIHDYELLKRAKKQHLDTQLFSSSPFQALSSVDTDPSQQEILHALENTRNILIQGPPGTGKSQSLTAILVNALENKRKTVVVCEKRTALEVLEQALQRLGLGHHTALIKDYKKDRTMIVDAVRNKVDLLPPFHSPKALEALQKTHREIQDLIEVIHSKHKKLDKPLIGAYPWSAAVGEFLKVHRKKTSQGTVNLQHIDADFSVDELYQIAESLEEAEKRYNDHTRSEGQRFLNPMVVKDGTPYDLEHEIHGAFAQYRKELEEILSEIRLYEIEYRESRGALLLELEKTMMEQRKSLQHIFTKHKDNPDFFNEEATQKASYVAGAMFSKEKKETLRDRNRVRSLYKNISTLSKKSLDLRPIDLEKCSLEEGRDIFKNHLKQIQNIRKQFDPRIKQTFQRLSLFDLTGSVHETQRLQGIVKRIQSLASMIEEHQYSVHRLILDNDKTIIQSIQDLLIEKERYFTSAKDLYLADFAWFQWYYQSSYKVQQLLDSFQGKKEWTLNFLHFSLNALLEKYADPDLPSNNQDYKALNRLMKTVQSDQVDYINESWSAVQKQAVKQFEEKYPITVKNLYNKKGSAQTLYSLRKIIQFDVDFFTTFFPVVLTTPDVCSTLFPYNKKRDPYFDIVMFDEASQLRVEDNIPALLKGKQIIIAGDEHQMPPSNYFHKLVDAPERETQIDDEEAEILAHREKIFLSCESLLDFGLEGSFQKTYLDFHYRSQHPHLIDFSNYAFYEQRLKPLPQHTVEAPIEYIHVGGSYIDRKNIQEAEAVIEVLEKKIHPKRDGSYPSVGIATFNITQRDLITNMIADRRRMSQHESFHKKILKLEESGLFVKNLENIQGDERDIIILSTTFGTTADGEFYHRFGPINQQQGYKLLNVIITRAKYKIYTCTSVPEGIFLKYKQYLNETKSNNRKAVFFAYLAYCKAVSSGDEEGRLAVLDMLAETAGYAPMASPPTRFSKNTFPSEVATALAKHIQRGTIVPHTALGGFTVDVLYTPQLKRSKKVVIECDASKDHGSNEAYLHDIHREKVLESHGCVFYRVWSVNWWRNPKRELTKLLEVIKKEDPRAVK